MVVLVVVVVVVAVVVVLPWRVLVGLSMVIAFGIKIGLRLSFLVGESSIWVSRMTLLKHTVDERESRDNKKQTHRINAHGQLLDVQLVLI